MKVTLAKEAGFCFGVRRASDMVLEHAEEGKKTNTLGPLIHNNQFTKYLEEKGVFAVDSVSNVNTEKIVVRSHGIPRDLEEDLRKKDLEIVDATCPFVKRVHRLAESLEREGYRVLIFGEEGHPEVVGIKSYAKKPIIVKDISAVPRFKKDEKIALISQTTQNLGLFEKLSNFLKENYQYVRIMNTICDATEKRQVAAKELAEKVEVMIIVGGKHSSNSSRLYDVCKDIVRSYHIEEAEELKGHWFSDAKNIGVTAGASTPDFIIKNVISGIKNYGKSS